MAAHAHAQPLLTEALALSVLLREGGLPCPSLVALIVAQIVLGHLGCPIRPANKD